MRICHLVTALDFGGVERQMRIIAESTSDRRGRIHFVAVGGGGRTADAIAAMGHDVTCLDAQPSVYAPATFAAVLRAILRLAPDVVHTHGAEANAHGLPAAFLARVPVRIGEEVGLPGHSAKGRFAFRQLYRFAQRVVAVSDVVADDLVRTGEARRDDIVVIEYPFRAMAAGSPAANGRARLHVCAVGRLIESKKIHDAVEALRLLVARGKPFDLCLVGDGPERPRLEAMVREHDLGDYVTFAGFQDRPEDFLRQSDLFVMPSAHEGCSIALIEAMAIGLPAVATGVGIAPQVIRDGESGWLVPVGDPGVLAATIERVMALPAPSRLAVGAAGRARVLDRNSPEQHVARLDALYETLHAGGAARRRTTP